MFKPKVNIWASLIVAIFEMDWLSKSSHFCNPLQLGDLLFFRLENERTGEIQTIEPTSGQFLEDVHCIFVI
jgi:hypothetical protein